MEENQVKSKGNKNKSYTTIHVTKEIKKRISSDLTRINKKDYGRTVRAEDYLAVAVSLITSQHIQQMQENSLCNADRLDRDYRLYVSEFGQITKDEYLGKRLSGEIGSSNKTGAIPEPLEPIQTSSPSTL